MHKGLRIIEHDVPAFDHVIVNGLQEARSNCVMKVSAIAMNGNEATSTAVS